MDEHEQPDFGDTPGAPLRLALWRRGQEFLGELDRVRQEPHGHAIHECRVASRRLQGLLQALLPVVGKKVGKKLTGAIRQSRRALSKLRDLHVQREWAEKHPELADFDEFLKTRQDRRSEQSAARLQKLHLGKLELQLEVVDAHLAGATDDAEGFEQVLQTMRDALEHSMTLANEAQQQIDPNRTQSYHRLRLQLKRFRYQLETFTELGSPGVPTLSPGQWEQLKSLHSTLGSLQDIEVLSQRLDRYWARQAPNRRTQHRMLGLLLKERDRQVAKVKPDFSWWKPEQH